RSIISRRRIASIFHLMSPKRNLSAVLFSPRHLMNGDILRPYCTKNPSRKGAVIMKNIPIALQMYTLREESVHDFAGTLKKVADLGYDGVELAGYGGLTAKVLRQLIDEYGLKAASSHIPLEDLKNNVDQVIADQIILGSNYIVCPFLPPESRTEQSYQNLIHLLDHVGEKCRTAGITLCYHNHDFELDRLADGRMALEAILDDTSPENVQAEFDIYWLAKGNEDPVDWLERYKGRTDRKSTRLNSSHV